jgi:UDP-glucose 4-epimerase
VGNPEVAIIGGSGFVGASLARHLSALYKVKVIDKKDVPDDIQGKVRFALCDINDYNEVSRALMGVDLVIHTAIIQIPKVNEDKRLAYSVNIAGTQNVCRAVDEMESVKGMLLTGSWHVFGERDYGRVINEDFGSRPDRTEARARLYALCKIGQETIMRIYDEMSTKIYGTVRIGTVLGEAMPKGTAADVFIAKGLRGEPITPFRQSMQRPMLYVDVNDVCRAFEAFAEKILRNELGKQGGSLAHIVNVFWPRPVTIMELAKIVREKIVNCSGGKTSPEIRVVDTGEPVSKIEDEEERIQVDTTKARDFLGIGEFQSPEQTIERLVKQSMLHDV